MESAAAAACVSRLSSPSSSSSVLFSPFSDQSHVDFYRPLVPPSLSLSLRSSSSRPSLFTPAVPPLRALSDSAVTSPLLDPPQVASALLKELAELKLQMKQKKKELKAQTKEEKKKLKMQMKEEMKMKDPTKDTKKKMKKCSSESSSSSESSDEECKSLSMRMLRQERSLRGCTEDQVVQKDLLERDAGIPAKAQVDYSIKTPCEASCSPPPIECAMDFATQSLLVSKRNCLDACGSTVNGVSVIGNLNREISVQKDVRGGQGLSSSRRGSASVLPSAQCANRIEVCAGGKCKKAGSEQLLSALCAHIPGFLNVEAVPCKCMGKCSMAMNVKVHKEDTNPQHHSQVRVEDANLILSHHFGLGRPPTGLPSVPSYDKVRVPNHLSAPACGV